MYANIILYSNVATWSREKTIVEEIALDFKTHSYKRDKKLRI